MTACWAKNGDGLAELEHVSSLSALGLRRGRGSRKVSPATPSSTLELVAGLAPELAAGFPATAQ
jgi:hypothetical protein